MYVNVVFVIRCSYSSVSLTLVREQLFIIVIIIIILIIIIIIIIIIYRLIFALSTDGTASGHVRRLLDGHWVLLVPV